jgi:hypothetical protein
MKLTLLPGRNTNNVGWERADIPSLFHVIARGEWGKKLIPSDGHGKPHWPCAVCKANNFTEQDYKEQLPMLLTLSPFEGADAQTAH